MYDWASVSSFDLYGLSWQGCILTIICCLMWEWQFLGLKILLKCQENILNFINCKGSSFQNILYQRAVYHLHIRWNSRRGFFYNITKVEIAIKRSWICKCERFLIFDVKNVLLFWWANSIKTNLQTCNLHTGQSIDYKSVN